MAFIYALIDPIEKTPKYIGYTMRSIKERFHGHLRDTKYGKRGKWIKELKENGQIPLIEVLDEVESNEALFWELHYIFLYRSWNFNLLNISLGEYGMTIKPPPCSDELKLIRRENAKRLAPIVTKINRESGLYLRAKIRMSGANNPMKKTMRSILQYDLNGEFIKEWKNMAEIFNKIQQKTTGIYECCNGNYKSCLGFIWKYKTDGYLSKIGAFPENRLKQIRKHAVLK